MVKKILPIETYLIVQMFIFGFMLILPNSSFDLDVFNIMSSIASEEMWGILCMIIGLVQFYSMIKSKRLLMIISFTLNTFIWSLVGTAIILSGHITLGTTYILLALFTFVFSRKIGG